MHNLNSVFFTFLFAITFHSFVQGQSSSVEEQAVKTNIQKLFDGMRAGDSSMVSAVFHPEIRMQTVMEKDGKTILHNGSAEKFLNAVGTPHEIVWDERIMSYEIKVDADMATAWTEYAFYAGEKFSHCGVNAFQFFKDDEKGWLITQIIDTRRKENCKK